MGWVPCEGAGLGTHRTPRTTRTQSEDHVGSREERGPHQERPEGPDDEGWTSSLGKGERGVSRKLAFATGERDEGVK